MTQTILSDRERAAVALAVKKIILWGAQFLATYAAYRLGGPWAAVLVFCMIEAR